MVEEVVRLMHEDVFTNYDAIRSLIIHGDVTTFESYRDPGPPSLDLIQLCIVHNYPEVIRLLFFKCFFKNERIKECSHYLHLACKLGRLSLAKIISEERPRDMNVKSCACYPEYHKENVVRTLPVDIAARYGHFRVLETLLFALYETRCIKRRSSIEPDNDVDSLLDRAIFSGSVAAVDLIIQTSKPSKARLHKALKTAVLRKGSSCVKCLLHHGADLDLAFPHINAYHVLFVCSMGFSAEREDLFSGADSTMAVLMQHSPDVNIHEPVGAFPLYSLLEALLLEVNTEVKRPAVLIRCLKLMLEAGADPNFDEIGFAQRRPDVRQAFGRKPWFSALHSFFSQIHVSAGGPIPCAPPEYIVEILELLLRYGANPYAKSPKTKLYPVCAFFRSFTVLSGAHSSACSYLARRLLRLFSQVMLTEDFINSLKIIAENVTAYLVSSESDSTTKCELLEAFDPSLYLDVHDQTLQHNCKVMIWKQCRWDKRIVLQLKLPFLLNAYLKNPLL